MTALDFVLTPLGQGCVFSTWEEEWNQYLVAKVRKKNMFPRAGGPLYGRYLKSQSLACKVESPNLKLNDDNLSFPF